MFSNFLLVAWNALIHCAPKASQDALAEYFAHRFLPFPLLEALQFYGFLLQSVGNWHLDNGATACLPVKLFGWDVRNQAFSLKLFDGLLNQSPSYGEIFPDGKQIFLYQYQPDVKIYYSYRAIAQGDYLYPTCYLIQAFACTDQLHWDLIVEGEYRTA